MPENGDGGDQFSGLYGPGAGDQSGESPQLLGVNELQQSIKSFNQSIKTLAGIYQQMSNPHTLGQNQNLGGPGGLPGQSQASATPNGGAGGFKQYMQQAFIANTPFTAASSPLGAPGQAGTTQQTPGQPTVAPGQPQSPNGGGAGFSTGIQQQMGQAPAGPNPTQPNQAGGQPPTGGSVTLGGMNVPLPASNTPAGKVAGGFAALAAGVSGAGEQAMPSQLALSNFSQQAGLMGSSAAQARYGAVGKGNAGINIGATGVPDAVSGQSTLAQLAGTTNFRGRGTAPAELRNTMGAANAIAYANPGMGYGNAANLTQSLYTPQGAYALNLMGVNPRQLPLGPNGRSRGFSTVAQGIIQRITGSATVNPNRFAQMFRTGGTGYLDLEQNFGAQTPELIKSLEMENLVARKSGMNPNQIQQLFNQAARPKNDAQGQAARAQLTKYGVSETDIQHMQAANAVKGGRQNELYGPFTKGLSAATATLSKFNEALNKALSGPLGTGVGYSQGFGGAIKAMASPGNLLGGGGGLVGGLLGSFLGHSGGGILGKVFGSTIGKVLQKTGLGDLVKGKLGGLKSIFSRGGAAGDEAAATGAEAAGGEAAAGEAGAAGLGGAAGPLGLGVVGGTMGIKALENLLKPATKKKGVAGSAAKGGESALSLADPTRLFKNPFSKGGVVSDAKGIWDSVTSIFGGNASRNQKGKNHPGGNKGGSSGGSAGVGGAAAKAVAEAETQLGVPYHWGWEAPGKGFDCSGLVQWSYNKAGVNLPRTSQGMFHFLKSKNRLVDKNQAQEGDLLFADGTDGGSPNNPGHVAMMVSNSKLIQAPFTGSNVSFLHYNPDDWTHVGRPSGTTKGKGSGGSGNSGSNGSSSSSSAGGSIGMGLDVGSYGSSEEIDVVSQGLLDEAGGGGVSTSQTQQQQKKSGGGSSGGGGGFTGTGGKAVYSFLLNNVFGGNKTAAAGATASIWGESKWNPESQGTGGRGLIGWTPPSTLPNSAFTGNASKDMGAQLRQIPVFIKRSGDEGAIGQMRAIHGNGRGAVTEAANIWMSRVERAGISDVHSEGISLAMKIAGLATGTDHADPGWSWVGERGPELINLKGGEQILPARESAKAAATAAGVAEVPWHLGKGTGGRATSTVTLNFDKDSIRVGNYSGMEAGKSHKQTMDEMVHHMKNELERDGIDLAIARGEHHG